MKQTEDIFPWKAHPKLTHKSIFRKQKKHKISIFGHSQVCTQKLTILL